MKKISGIVASFLFCVCSFCFSESRQGQIISGNLFEGIPASPEAFRNNSEYRITDRAATGHLSRTGAEREIMVQNDAIILVYWEKNSRIELQWIQILRETDIHYLGSYIGMRKSEILATFGNPMRNARNVLFYIASGIDSDFFINFSLSRDIVSGIMIIKISKAAIKGEFTL